MDKFCQFKAGYFCEGITFALEIRHRFNKLTFDQIPVRILFDSLKKILTNS